MKALVVYEFLLSNTATIAHATQRQVLPHPVKDDKADEKKMFKLYLYCQD